MNPAEAPPLRPLTRPDVEAVMAAGPPPYDFSYAELTNVDLSGVGDLSNASFQGSRLSRVILNNARLRNANLTNAVLYEVALKRADCSGAVFSGADLQIVRAKHSDFTNVDFRNARLTHVQMDYGTAFATNFTGATLQKSWLHEADCSYAMFDYATFREVNAKRANFSNASFQSADLDGTKLQKANLTGVNFRDANLNGGLLMESDLRGANFSGTQLFGAILADVQLDPNFDDSVKMMAAIESKTVVEADLLPLAEYHDPNAHGNAVLGAAIDHRLFDMANCILRHPAFAPANRTVMAFQAAATGDLATLRLHDDAYPINPARYFEVALHNKQLHLLASLVRNAPVLSEKLIDIAMDRVDINLVDAILSRTLYPTQLLRRAALPTQYPIIDLILTRRPEMAFLDEVQELPADAQAYLHEFAHGGQARLVRRCAEMLFASGIPLGAEAVIAVAREFAGRGQDVELLHQLHYYGYLAPLLLQHFGTERTAFGEAYAALSPLAEVVKTAGLVSLFGLDETIAAQLPSLPQRTALLAGKITRALLSYEANDNARVAAGTMTWTKTLAERAVDDIVRPLERGREAERMQQERAETAALNAHVRNANYYLKQLPDIYRDTGAAAQEAKLRPTDDVENIRMKLSERAQTMREALERFVEAIHGRQLDTIADTQHQLAHANAAYQDTIEKHLQPMESAARGVLFGYVAHLCETPAAALSRCQAPPLAEAAREHRARQQLRALERRNIGFAL